MKPFILFLALAVTLAYAAEDKKPETESKSKKRGIYDEGNHINFDVNLYNQAPQFHQSSGAHLGAGDVIYGKPYSLDVAPLTPQQLNIPLGNLYSSKDVSQYAPAQPQISTSYQKLSLPLPLTLPLRLEKQQIQPVHSFVYKQPVTQTLRAYPQEILVKEPLQEEPYVPPPPIRRPVAPVKPVQLGSGALGYTRLSNGGIALGSGSLGYGGNLIKGRLVQPEAIGENAFRNIESLLSKGPLFVTESQLQGLAQNELQQQQGLQGYQQQSLQGIQQQTLQGIQQQSFQGIQQQSLQGIQQQSLQGIQQQGLQQQGLQGFQLQSLQDPLSLQGPQSFGSYFASPLTNRPPAYTKVPVKYTNVAPYYGLQSSEPNFEFLQSSFVKGLY